MAEDKQAKILQDLVREADRVKNGILIIEFKIHAGDLALAEIISERRKLG